MEHEFRYSCLHRPMQVNLTDIHKSVSASTYAKSLQCDFRHNKRIQPQFILSTLTLMICWGSLHIYPKAFNTTLIPLDLTVPSYLGWLLPSALSMIIQPDSGVRAWAVCPSFQPSSHLSQLNGHDQSDPTIFLRAHFSENIGAVVVLVQRNRG